LFIAGQVWGQGKASVALSHKPMVNMAAQAAGGLTLTIVNLSDGARVGGGGALDLGSVSYGSAARKGEVEVRSVAGHMVVSTKVGLSIADPARHLTAATLLASEVLPESSYVLRLDGVRLTTAPQVIRGQIPVGKLSTHRLEIEVPSSVTEKSPGLHNSIIFQVVPN
jgi:hypothetical protein